MRRLTALQLAMIFLCGLLLAAGPLGCDEAADDDTADDDTSDDDTGDDDTLPDDDTEPVDGDGDGFSAEDGDCNDKDPDIHPGAIEECNGIDDNCDDVVDEGYDVDGDGNTTCGADGEAGTEDDDCDDNDASLEQLDLDGDGYSTCDGDCDDDNGDVNPGAQEVCGDGLDNDCGDDPEECEIAGTIDLTNADAIITGEGSADQAGYAVAGGGDLDGDGTPDLLFGAPYADYVGGDSGAVYGVFGPADFGTLDLGDADVRILGQGGLSTPRSGER